jgi:hypothetical protein
MRILKALLLCAGLTVGAAEPAVISGGSSGPDVDSEVGSILRARGFTPPLLFPGTNRDTWLTCDRLVDSSQFDRALVCVRQRGEVIVQIQHSRVAASDWHVVRPELYQCGSGNKESEALFRARLWFPGPVKGFGLFPWHLRGTNVVGAGEAQGVRERAFRFLGYALDEEAVETEEGLRVRLSGCRYVGDPVSPEGLEAAAVGRAIWERLRKRSAAAHREK